MSEGRARAPAFQPLEALLVGLTFLTGMVDAITYLGLGHVFTANMTGNVVLLGFALVGADQVSIAGSLLSLAAFVVGAALGGRIGRVLQPRSERRVLSSLALEAALLGGAAAWTLLWPTVTSSATVILLALAMGMRNATVRQIAVPDLTTTVLTGTLTDLGIHLQTRDSAPRAQLRRLAAVVALLTGAATGALVLRGGLATAILATLGVLVLESAAYVLSLRRAQALAPAAAT